MAYLISHFWPGANEEQYRKTLAAVHPADGLPAGQTYHAAATVEGGIQIIAIWDSKEAADAFVTGTLMPAMPIEGGVSGHPDERAGTIVNIETA